MQKINSRIVEALVSFYQDMQAVADETFMQTSHEIDNLYQLLFLFNVDLSVLNPT